MVRRKIFALTLIVLAVTAGGVFGYRWWTTGRFQEKTDNAYVESEISIVAPKVAGYIAQMMVEENQPVHAGDLIAVIDQAEYKTKVMQTEALVSAAEAALATNVARLSLGRAGVSQAEAEMHSADADRQRADEDLVRYRELNQRQFASKQRYELAIMESRKSEAAMAKSRAAVTAKREEVNVQHASRKELEAQLAEAKAQLAAAKLDLANTELHAPVDGIIGNRTMRMGQYVKAGTQLMSVVPLEQVYVIANFKETQVARFHAGQKVKISIDAYPDQKIEGQLTSIAPASGAKFSLLPAENATGNFTKIVQRIPVRIDLAAQGGDGGLLRPGMSVEVMVDTKSDFTSPAKSLAGAR